MVLRKNQLGRRVPGPERRLCSGWQMRFTARLAPLLVVTLVIGESRQAEPIISFPTRHDENLFTSLLELDTEQRSSLDKGNHIVLPSVFIGLESNADGEMMAAIMKAAGDAEAAEKSPAVSTSADASRFARVEAPAPTPAPPADDNVPGPLIPKPDPTPTIDPSSKNAPDPPEKDEEEPLFPPDSASSIKEPLSEEYRSTSDNSPHSSTKIPYSVHIGSHYYCGCMLYGMPRKLHCSVSASHRSYCAFLLRHTLTPVYLDMRGDSVQQTGPARCAVYVYQ